jgi:predicted thioesterase
MNIPGIKIGLTGIVQKCIEKEDTALLIGSGALKTLLATPALIAMMIEASVKAVDPLLLEGFITVGKTINVTHEKPTCQGMTVTVKSVLKAVEGNKLTFELWAYDEVGLIGRGTHERYIVSQKGILEQAEVRKRLMESGMICSN